MATADLVLLFVLQLVVVNTVQAGVMDQPDMSILTSTCREMSPGIVRGAPLVFQLPGYCMTFTCYMNTFPTGNHASITSQGCNFALHSTSPCYIRDYDLTRSYPACCPATVCPGDRDYRTDAKQLAIPQTPQIPQPLFDNNNNNNNMFNMRSTFNNKPFDQQVFNNEPFNFNGILPPRYDANVNFDQKPIFNNDPFRFNGYFDPTVNFDNTPVFNNNPFQFNGFNKQPNAIRSIFENEPFRMDRAYGSSSVNKATTRDANAPGQFEDAPAPYPETVRSGYVPPLYGSWRAPYETEGFLPEEVPAFVDGWPFVGGRKKHGRSHKRRNAPNWDY